MSTTQNYFSLFQLPLAYQLDVAQLRAQYLSMSRQYHPDFHTLQQPEHQAEMLAKYTLVNQAYRTLSDPSLRLQHLLQCHQVLPEEANAPLPQAFLLDMMELNELLMALEMDSNPAVYANAVTRLEALEVAAKAEAEPILDNWKSDDISASQLEIVRNYYLKSKYLLRMKENLSKFAPR